MGEIQIGDVVFDEKGEPVNVTNVYKPGPRQLYKLTFSDGCEIVSSCEHDWITHTRRERSWMNRTKAYGFPKDWATCDYGTMNTYKLEKKTTQEIVDTLTYSGRGDTNHSIPTCFPLQMEERDLPIDPYIMGLWLGDGNSNGSGFTCGEEDLKHFCDSLGRDVSFARDNPNAFFIPDTSYRARLREMSLYNNKHVPKDYLYASFDQRLALLQGLMDSDGYAGKSHVEFSNTRKDLAEGVLWLARSIGDKPSISESRATLYGKDCGPKFRVWWKPSKHIPFRLKRKADKVLMEGDQFLRNQHRMIKKAEKVEWEPTTCITVDNDSHLFLVGEGLIPTHNSYTMCATMKRAVERHHLTKMMLIAPVSRDIKNNLYPQLIAMYPDNHPNRPELKINTIVWPKSGAEMVLVPSSAGPDAVRGYSNEMLFVDELCFLDNVDEIMTQALLTLRSDPAICVAATTPKAVPFLIDLVNDYNNGDTGIKIIRGKTADNAANLNETFMKTMENKYGGTTLGRVELEGELVLTNADALVQRADIDRNIVDKKDLPQFVEIGIGLDIALISDKGSVGRAKGGRTPDATGIFVSGVDKDGLLYALDSYTGRYAPADWAGKVSSLYDQYVTTGHRVKIYIESNQGGQELITNAFDNIGRSEVARIAKFIFSKENKMQRLLPYALLIEQGRIKFNQQGREMESLYTELTSFTGRSGEKSPDTLDAAVFSWKILSPVKKSYVKDMEFLC